ncbi:hypothetical protein JMJ77_0015394, partial [Colletotrichum scovillei]
MFQALENSTTTICLYENT